MEKDSSEQCLNIFESNQISAEEYNFQGWNKDEKIKLLQSLKEYTSSEVNLISKDIGTKSVEEVADAIKYYKRKAELISTKKRSQRISKLDNLQSPLEKWARILTDTTNFSNLCTETSTAIHLIAELEKFPSKIYTENIDFKKLYYIISSALDGKTLPEDTYIKAVIENLILQATLRGKTFIKTSVLRNVIKNMKFKEKEQCSFLKLNENPEIAAIQHLLHQVAFNPLNINPQYLKSSPKTDKLEEMISEG